MAITTPLYEHASRGGMLLRAARLNRQLYAFNSEPAKLFRVLKYLNTFCWVLVYSLPRGVIPNRT
jgi:hypothetical protein